MGLTAEDIVTQMLSEQEILGIGMSNHMLMEHSPIYITDSAYNLGHFLRDVKPEPSKFGAKYVFVR